MNDKIKKNYKKKTDEIVKQVSGGRNVSLLQSGLGADGKQDDDTQQETTSRARTLGLCRMSVYGLGALPAQLLGRVKERHLFPPQPW